MKVEGKFHYRRVTDLLLGYWNIIRGNRRLASVKDVNPEDIDEIWENCFIVDITLKHGSPHYSYSYLGHLIKDAYGLQLSTDDTPPLASPFVERLAARYEEVMRTRAPVIEEDAFINARGETIRYRQVLLPLGSTDGTVTHLLGAMRFKLYPLEDK